MTSSHVYVIGNAAVDETILIDRFPAPGASIHGRSIGVDLGGKGLNQAVAIARCGIATTLVAAIGNDDRGELIKRRLADEPLSTTFVLTSVATDSSMILRDRAGENANITTTASAAYIDGNVVAEALSTAREGDVLLIQGNLSPSAAKACVQSARTKGMLVVANPSPYQRYFSNLWPFIDIVFVNEGEANMLSKDETHFDPSFCWSLGLKVVVRSLGERGAELHTPHNSAAVPADKVVVTDTTGAGDVFLATALASALARNSPIDNASVTQGVRAAATAVTREGAFSSLPSCGEFKTILMAKAFRS